VYPQGNIFYADEGGDVVRTDGKYLLNSRFYLPEVTAHRNI
jgi:hypothetical protein